MSTAYADPNLKQALDPSLYSLSDGELAFFKSQTGIEDEDALKQHIITAQTKAYNVYGYPCIRSFSFTRMKISSMPAYKAALKVGSERKNAILLDIGCCFGDDVRKAVFDGWPVQNAIGSDLHKEFWDIGHELFNSTPETFPAPFIPGDVLDSAMITPRSPLYSEPDMLHPPLSSLTSLTPLQGHVSVIHASSLFHLFDEEKQLELARRLASLLSPLPGSVIFGSHGGLPVKGRRTVDDLGKEQVTMFGHSPESWDEIWDGEVFQKGSVEVKAVLKEAETRDFNLKINKEFFLLWWSVTRL